MGFEVSIREMNIRCSIGGTVFKIIDSNRGVFSHSFPAHMHSFYELHYIIRGRGLLIADNAEYDLRAGIMFVTSPRVAHTQITDRNDNMEEYFVSFDIDRQKSDFVDEVWEKVSGMGTAIAQSTHNAEDEFRNIETELINKEYGYRASVELLFSRILICAARDLCPQNSKEYKKATVDEMRRSIIDQAMLFHSDTITLNKLAELVNLHPRHIQRLIKDQYGLSFAELKKQIRMNKAADRLVSDAGMSIDDVAEYMGYGDRFYFSKQFKEFFGMTPAEYRDMMSSKMKDYEKRDI